MKTSLIALSAAALLAAPALAQQTPTGPRPVAAAEEASSSVSPRHAAAQAAGYRALHLCTATFSSGLPKDIIDRTGSGQSAKGETRIDEAAKTVTVKFADDELLGIPHRIVVGDKGLERGVLEYKARAGGAGADVPAESVVQFLRERSGTGR